MAWHGMALNLPLMAAYLMKYKFPYLDIIPDIHVRIDYGELVVLPP